MKYSHDDAVYVIAIRSAGPKNGREVEVALEAIRNYVEPVTAPVVVAYNADDEAVRRHDAMRALGFGFDAANQIFTVVSQDEAV